MQLTIMIKQYFNIIIIIINFGYKDPLCMFVLKNIPSVGQLPDKMLERKENRTKILLTRKFNGNGTTYLFLISFQMLRLKTNMKKITTPQRALHKSVRYQTCGGTCPICQLTAHEITSIVQLMPMANKSLKYKLNLEIQTIFEKTCRLCCQVLCYLPLFIRFVRGMSPTVLLLQHGRILLDLLDLPSRDPEQYHV